MIAVRPYWHTDHYWQVDFDTDEMMVLVGMEAGCRAAAGAGGEDDGGSKPAASLQTGSTVVAFQRCSTKLVLQSCTLGWRNSESITKRE